MGPHRLQLGDAGDGQETGNLFASFLSDYSDITFVQRAQKIGAPRNKAIPVKDYKFSVGINLVQDRKFCTEQFITECANLLSYISLDC